jgi:regulator of nucleoside diphosphate kinase
MTDMQNAPLAQNAISVAARDYDRLCGLADGIREAMPALSAYLQGELDRASIVADADPASVQMGSQVSFRDHASGRVHEVRLVYPAESDMPNGRLSVLTPVGSALLGLCAGATVSCSGNAGPARALTVVAVRPPPAEGG